jgi:very-short-patch-repair endonuclease
MRESETRSRPFARQLRQRLTKSEAILWTAIKGRALDGWRFRRQHPVGPYVTDFACHDAMLVVEVDGATHTEDHEIEYDRKRSAYLAQQGWRVMRVSNLSIYEDLDSVIADIAAALPPLGPSGHSPRKRGETKNSAPLSSPACGGGVRKADGGGETKTEYTPQGGHPQ